MSAKIVQTAQATIFPVSLSEAKNWLRVDESADDQLIQSLIGAAARRLEQFCDTRFLPQSFDVFLDRFQMSEKDIPYQDGVVDGPVSMFYGSCNHIDLPIGPIITVDSFKTIDDSGTEYLFPADQYVVDSASRNGRISLKLGGVWPTTILRRVNGIKISVIVGLKSAAADLPEEIKTAVLLTVAKMYENRGDSTQSEFFGTSGFTIPNTAQMLLESYRQVRIG